MASFPRIMREQTEIKVGPGSMIFREESAAARLNIYRGAASLLLRDYNPARKF